MSLCGKEGPGSRRFGRSLIPVTDGRSRRIVLKNSNFCIDHNTGTAGGLDEKFLRGFGGPTGFAACDAPICPAVRTIGGDDATRAKTRFSRWLNFRVFQQYRRKPVIADRDGGRRSSGERSFALNVIGGAVPRAASCPPFAVAPSSPLRRE